MAKQMIFVNLPVADLNKSVEFFTSVGYSFNPQFTDENATAMIVSEEIYVMLLTESYFKGFTKKEIADTSKVNEVIVCLSAESREAVDEVVNKAVDAGASTIDKQEHGFMYGWGFLDPDGHRWEYAWMDMSAMSEAPEQA